MLSFYHIKKTWFVTYQHNEHSPVETLYEGDDKKKALEIVDAFLEERG